MDSYGRQGHEWWEPKKLIRAIKTGKGVTDYPILGLHFLMEKYGGRPSEWDEEDMVVCHQLFEVNSIIQKVAEREEKKRKFKARFKGKKK